MKILVGNNQLKKTGGSENYTFALAIELKRQGHEVHYFTYLKGEVSDRLEQAGIPFMSSDSYDLLLLNHQTVVDALWHLGYTIQTCHGPQAELEQPSPLADEYVSVSEEVAQHLKSLGYESTVILNGIDCNRFRTIHPVSNRLTTVLSVCQSQTANDFVRQCCQELGVEFLQSNKHIHNVWAMEELINRSDLVVGLGRSAYDAMACGRVALSWDSRDYMGESLGDGLLTPETIGESIRCNCSGRAKRIRFTREAFINELRKYTPELAAWSREFALQNLNIQTVAERYIERYMQAVDRGDAVRTETIGARIHLVQKRVLDIQEKYQQAQQNLYNNHLAYLAYDRKIKTLRRMLLFYGICLVLLVCYLIVF